MLWMLRLAPTLLMIALGCIMAGCAGDTTSKIPYADIPKDGDAAQGEILFNQSVDLAPPCSSCHNTNASAVPFLDGYGAAAGSRVAGEDAFEYTFWSITEPGRFILEGYANAMYNLYDEKLTPQQIGDLIAYLLSL